MAKKKQKKESLNEVQLIAKVLNTTLRTTAFSTDPTKLLSNVKRWLPTGSFLYDLLTVNGQGEGGGLPLGRVAEVYGPPDVGKSTWAICSAREAIKDGCICVYIDKENALDMNRAAMLGLDFSSVIYFEATTIENVFKFIAKTMKTIREHKDIKTDKPVVFFWDTLARTMTDSQSKGSNPLGSVARSVRASIVTDLADSLPANDATLVIMNHRVVNNIQSGAVGSVGGSALWHEASIRTVMTYVGGKAGILFDNDEIPVGQIARCTIKESNVSSPKREIRLRIYFATGIDDLGSMYDFLCLHSGFTVAGSWKSFVFKEKEYKFQSEDTFRKFIAEDETLIEHIKQLTKDTFFALYKIGSWQTS